MTPRRRSKTSTLRIRLDQWHATIARYLGLAMLLYSMLIDHFHNLALIPAATGLIFYKTVTLAARNGKTDDEE